MRHPALSVRSFECVTAFECREVRHCWSIRLCRADLPRQRRKRWAWPPQAPG